MEELNIEGYTKEELYDLNRNLYLHDFLNDKYQGPMENLPSKVKPWLKDYSKEQISTPINKQTAYEFVYSKVAKSDYNATAMTYYGNKITYGEFFKNVDKFSRAFKKQGIKKDDIVTIAMPNTPEAVYAFYALNKLGAIANMVHPLASANEIVKYTNLADAKMVVLTDLHYEKFNKANEEFYLDNDGLMKSNIIEKALFLSIKDSMPWLTGQAVKLATRKKTKNNKYNEKYLNLESFMEGIDDNYNIGSFERSTNDEAVFFHTSGTTNKTTSLEDTKKVSSKRAVVTNKALNNSVQNLRASFKDEEYALGKYDSVLAVLPIFHGFGLGICVHFALGNTMNSLLIAKPDMAKLDKTVKKLKPNCILGTPSMFQSIFEGKALKNADLSFLKYSISGADKLKEDKAVKFEEVMINGGAVNGINTGYGLSEMANVVTRTFGENRDLNTVGIPTINNEIKIVNTDNEELLFNEVGEIVVRGPQMMLGYYNNPDATGATIQIHEDGYEWIHTGDLGAINENGELTFKGRLKQTMIVNGYNVEPDEIETVINKHPLVNSSVAFGIDHDLKGQVVGVCLILEKGADLNEIREDLYHLCKENLPLYAQPKDIFETDEFPLNLMGKVDRNFIAYLYNNDEEKTLVKKA